MITQLDIKDFSPAADKTIWDVRDAKSYKAGHIKYATHQPLDSLNQALLDSTSGDIYVLCGGGTKAARAAALLDGLDGSRHIIHLTGGTRGAKALGWELITEE